MRSLLRTGSLSLLIMLFALATLGQEQTPPEEPVKPNPETEKEKLERVKPFDGDVEFPEVEGWQLSRKTRYPQRELGYSVNYESRTGGRVTVYVYNGGLSSIPNDLSGPVETQMRQAKTEIQAITEAGYYDSATEVRSSTVTLGGQDGNVKALYSLYLIIVEGRELDSEIYLFAYENYFVKLRATRPKGMDGPKNDLVGTLLLEMDRLFSH